MAKILVVDDDAGIRNMLLTMLTMEGHCAIGASNGERGWTLLQDNPDFSLMICDVVMPGLGGKELVMRVRENPQTFRFPIIMISGFVPFKDIRSILELGVEKFVPKPFHATEILDEINSCLA